ncbi:3-oxo-tetronate 4-phosphate decarboxylase [Belnapia rosea]|uniref:3-oxo-tetronate 4-phosphate decarboxylase n=1 Tax=Belnapia rosea TaxID=938405 RepID=A0A1G6JDP8_9PROT|nr:aldolase [Belnapia rosea]SDB11325.1 Ribulose-5-phosphate 4-epimerase/Fuculose-1-phosphate aldolase [Belnapia rosea]SDC16904.1 Ribulose-5-phosphate 4-epimerase/Fuculose-1-phosphate aldolase [Belnapia rosea]
MSEDDLRDAIAAHGRLLFGRGFSVGSAGNISVRLPDGFLMTPTNSCLGRLDPARISKLDREYRHVSGDKPSKEVFMHRAFLEARPEAEAVVHLHSTHATAIACLATPGEPAPIPPLTPYFVMRIGRVLPVIPYYRPGDAAMEPAIAAAARDARAVLLANHGPVVSGKSLDDAVYAAEELEEAAKLALLLRGQPARLLTEAQVEDLLGTFG